MDAGAIFAVSECADAGPGMFDRLRLFVTERLARARGLAPPLALMNFVSSLRERTDWSGSRLKRYIKAAKYLARVLCMPLRHGRYLDFVYRNQAMCTYRRRDPRVLERHFHRYINAHWNRSARLLSIQSHYRFVLTRLPKALFEAIYTDGNATLGTVTLKDGSPLKLCLRPPILMGCEGELSIELRDANDHLLYRIVLSVIDYRPTIAIGCIQGPAGESSRDVVRDLTRNMHGMRPKQLMLSLAYAFARQYGIKRIWTVSNAAHPLRQVRRTFQADYDAFWQEQGGRQVGNGWFILPEQLSRKSESEVPSNHRSAFRRREALRIEIERLLGHALEAAPAWSARTPLKQGLESAKSYQDDRRKASWIS
ncbi:DUF535 domain-containing protein [Dyella tabacisoli]|uniref:DUF535 domain-containing protein n=2 Tax=Dyella tabacisoli TaxID=2282381 RepID=A0A369USC7_9GAMM|nr:DUF535 domain-containing protein [Dyella tabacisoli]